MSAIITMESDGMGRCLIWVKTYLKSDESGALMFMSKVIVSDESRVKKV